MGIYTYKVVDAECDSCGRLLSDSFKDSSWKNDNDIKAAIKQVSWKQITFGKYSEFVLCNRCVKELKNTLEE